MQHDAAMQTTASVIALVDTNTPTPCDHGNQYKAYPQRPFFLKTQCMLICDGLGLIGFLMLLMLTLAQQ